MITCFSCQKSEQLSKDAVAKEELDLRHFSNIPEEVNGCSCYLSASNKEFQAKEYLYVDNLTSVGYVHIGNNIRRLKVVKLKNHEPSTYKVLKDSLYTVIIDLSQTSELDETWQQKGQMTVTSKDGNTTTKQIVGECGC